MSCYETANSIPSVKEDSIFVASMINLKKRVNSVHHYALRLEKKIEPTLQ